MFLDNQFDATVTCPVARRASLAQGKALLTIWEKAFLEDKAIGHEYRYSVKGGNGGHFGIAWGVVCAHCNISLGMVPFHSCSSRSVHLCISIESCKSGYFGCCPVKSCWTLSGTDIVGYIANETSPETDGGRSQGSRLGRCRTDVGVDRYISRSTGDPIQSCLQRMNITYLAM